MVLGACSGEIAEKIEMDLRRTGWLNFLVIQRVLVSENRCKGHTDADVQEDE